MGYRLEGPVIEHREGADIISDAIPPGAVQVPGSGQPIIMLADGQTTGGYAKIAVITSMARCALAQLLPGGSVRFQRISQKEAISEARQIEMKLNKLKEARAVFSTRQKDDKPALIMEEEVKSGSMKLKIDEKNWDIQWELIE
jgi:allophanate hydrolase subunit 2